MPNSNPYDMIHKARRYAAAADRWAVLKANMHDRTPLNPLPQQTAPQQAEPAQGSAAQTAPHQSLPPSEPGRPQLSQPPFPPPQPRHPYMDEIVQRHEQAWKAAMPLQAWTPEPPPPQGAWREPAKATAGLQTTTVPAERSTPPASNQQPAATAAPDAGAKT